MLFSAPVSCFALAAAEIDRRKEIALAREIELCATHRPEGRYGREILWHPDFATDCVALVSELPLSEVTAWLASELPGYANEGVPLDLTDYSYLADVLREGLADSPAPLARVRLERALTWVEQMGAYLLKPRPAPVPAEVTPASAEAALAPAEDAPASAPTPYTVDEATKAVLACTSREAMLALWPNLQGYEGGEEFDLAVAASKVRWAAPDYNSPEQAEREVASRQQRDYAHKLLASGKNDGFRLEALHQLADVGLSWAQCSSLVDTAKANVDRPAPLTVAMLPAPSEATPGLPQYATVAQREEIIRLLNHPLITRQEKTKHLLNINRLDEEKATEAIAKLRKAIETREGTTALAA